MTTYTDAALKAEIQPDPAVLGYAGKTPFQVATLLNAPKYTAYQPAAMTAVLKWAASTGVMTNIQDAANKAGSFTAITAANRAIVLAVQYMLQGGIAALDVSDPAIVGSTNGVAYTPGAPATANGMLDALVSAGVMTAAQKDSLIALGQYQASRAQVLFGTTAPPIDADRVMAALRS